MSETRFTPGPYWLVTKFEDEADVRGMAEIHSSTRYPLVELEITDMETEANARLFTAAPQMHDALKRMTLLVATIRNLYGSAAAEFIANGEAYKDAVAALALAEGKDEEGR